VPIITVTMVTGRDQRQIRALIAALTEAAHAAIGAPVGSIRVIISEVPPAHFAAGDVTIEERRSTHDS
jgi:4-oxalocrotonate tautomerase